MVPLDRRQGQESPASLAPIASLALRAVLPLPVRARSGLSARLLWLTLGFVMAAQLIIVVPLISSVRMDYLGEKLDTAHLVLTALEVATTEIDPRLRDTLLHQSGMLGMTAHRPNLPPRTLGPGIPSRLPILYDLRKGWFGSHIVDAFVTMFRPHAAVIAVTGLSTFDRKVVMEVVFDEQLLRRVMWDGARRLIGFGLLISVVSAWLVYVSLQWLAIRPLRRLTGAITTFQKAPEDPARIITPSNRADEVGVAEHALAAMQRALRQALLEKDRLAGVGTAVAKISHDLKNILSTAMLELDRMETAADPEVRRMTASMMRAVERAVHLSATTLTFAKESLPKVNKQTLGSVAFLAGLQNLLQAACPGCDIRVIGTEEFSFSADPELLTRVFENLARNAAEAGATALRLRAAREEDMVVIRISDNGPGLPQKAVDNLFVPFAGSYRAGGAGLGLPIARELVRVQGGDMDLSTTSEAGTSFAVRLPL